MWICFVLKLDFSLINFLGISSVLTYWCIQVDLWNLQILGWQRSLCYLELLFYPFPPFSCIELLLLNHFGVLLRQPNWMISSLAKGLHSGWPLRFASFHLIYELLRCLSDDAIASFASINQCASNSTVASVGSMLIIFLFLFLWWGLGGGGLSVWGT